MKTRARDWIADALASAALLVPLLCAVFVIVGLCVMFIRLF
ncbi:hypothetical protein PSQ39_21290 [Curvibacter sp. HBC28]|uniref:Uncharacterized protein n=1 Tax=Curvibacter microcysteis TaxID=3026419 RepID=A0ABT5MKZ2_9BURK|nr:hypothetical protein [Curvibacter sp. HBC28]MDD0817183.1 hypothetical protein [Curvibacter sp. HBC28]